MIYFDEKWSNCHLFEWEWIIEDSSNQQQAKSLARISILGILYI